MRRQQLEDMIHWCAENIDEDGRALCLSVRGALHMNTVTFSNSVDWLSERFTGDAKEGQQDSLLNIKPWDLAQYLGISDYLYVSHMLSESSLEDLLAPISRDDALIYLNPDLRAEQVARVLTSLNPGPILGDN